MYTLILCLNIKCTYISVNFYGIVACPPGYHGKNCSSVCPPKTYGYVCEKSCNKCSTCHHVYGCDWMSTTEGKTYTIQILTNIFCGEFNQHGMKLTLVNDVHFGWNMRLHTVRIIIWYLIILFTIILGFAILQLTQQLSYIFKVLLV